VVFQKKTVLRQGVCVCVELLNKSKTSTVASFSAFGFQQGDVACNQGPRSSKLPDCMGYRAWSALRTCSIFQFVWQAAKPTTAQPFLHSCTIGAIWDRGERTTTNLLILTSYTGSSWLVGPMCSPPLIRNNWSVVLHGRRIPRHNSIRHKTSLSKCVSVIVFVFVIVMYVASLRSLRVYQNPLVGRLAFHIFYSILCIIMPHKLFNHSLWRCQHG